MTASGGPTTGNMTVKWLAPLTLNGSPLLNYSVVTATDGGAFGAPVTVGKVLKRILPCAGVSSCDFRVYATNGAGTSGPSNVANGTWAVPSKPTILTVTGGPAVGQMSMTVRSPASNGGKEVSGFLYDVQVNSTGGWTGPFAVTGAGPRTVGCSSILGSGGCSYRIYAVNDVGSSLPSAVLAGSWNLPKAPGLISVKPGPLAGGATIEWQGPGDTGGLAPSFSYEIAVDGGSFGPGASSLPSNPKKASVECPGTNNCSYRVTATNAKGAGPASNVMTTAFNPPGRIANPLATVTSVADLNLGSGTPTATVTWGAPPNTGGLAITGYDGRMCTANLGNCDETDSAWAAAPVVSLGNTTTWRIPCPAGLITCTFEVRAINSLGNGPWGAAARLTPFAVTNVVATTAAPAGNVTIIWTGPAEAGAGVVQIALYSCLTTSGCGNTSNWSNTGIAISGNPQTVTHNCGQGVSCTYRVVAIGSGGAGSSASSATSVAAGSTLPDAPSGLTASSHPSMIGAVNLGWTVPSNSGSFPVSDYVFQRSVNSGPFSAPISTGSTSLTYTDSGCGASNSCTYQVAAVTSAGTGSYSNTATAEGANVPSAPLNLQSSQGVSLGSVNLTWQAPLDNGGNAVMNYFVERSFDGGSTYPFSTSVGNVLSYTDLTCGVNVSCTYRVSADNSVGRSAPSNTATATGTSVNAPTSLTATTSTANGNFGPVPASNLGGVDLSWTASTTPGATYEFRVSTNGGLTFAAWSSTTGLQNAGPTSGTHLCTTTNTNTTCTYEVRAVVGIYASGPSNQATAAALTDHVAPAVTVTTPANNSAASSTTPTLSGAAGDAVGDSTTVTVAVKQGVSVVRTFNVTRSGATWTVGALDWAAGSPSSLADGTYTVQATQVDWAANTGSSNTNTFTVDTNAPVVSVTAPVNGQLYLSGTTTFNTGSLVNWSGSITGTASDAGSGVNNVRVSIRQGTGNYWNGTSFGSASEVLITATGTTSWSLAFPASNFPAGGAYTVRAVGTDNTLNVSSGTSKTFNLDYDPANAVFVATTGNDSSGTGLTPTSPKATIGAGLVVATTAARTWVVVASGSYGALSVSGATIGNARIVAGGFNSSTWLRAAPGTNTVTIAGSGTAVTVDAKTGETFQQLTISASSTGVTGDSTYGVRLINTSTGTQLERVIVSAAAGVNGTNGTAGTGNAGAASNGGGGGGACGNCGTRGAAGTSGAGVGGRNGSQGGLGAPNTNTTGDAGVNGILNGAGGGNGGAGGVSAGSCNDARGGAGGGRSTATTGGTAGSAGASGTVTLGTTNATWNGGANGGSGSAGGDGHGGGGGGGGGGDSGSFISCTGDAGAGGGGGGGGGGAGTGVGTGGTAAGGSFGVYVVGNSSATITNSTLTAANGGTGGTGGTGATATAGGNGGSGGNCDTGQEAGSGGGGGGGSGGGGAGGGGGGAAGPSITVYESGTLSVTFSGTNTLNKGTSPAGTGGAGGTGGTGGGAGTRGNNAVAENINSNGCYAGFNGAAGTSGTNGGAGNNGGSAALSSYIDSTSTP